MTDIRTAPSPEHAPLTAAVAGSAMGDASRASLRARAGALLLELVIVFVGVCGAFLLQDWAQRRDQDRRRQQIYGALTDELKVIATNTRGVATQVPALLARYDSAWQAGMTPPLEPLLDPVQFTPHMWQAAMASGGLELLDVPTMYRVSSLYNDLEAAFAQYHHLTTLSAQQILPVLARNGSFYDPTTKRLRPEYRWYVVGLRRLGAVSAEVAAESDSLIALLERRRQD